MKLTENEPKERTFTLELSETELRWLWLAVDNAEFDLGEHDDGGMRILDNFTHCVLALGVKP